MQKIIRNPEIQAGLVYILFGAVVAASSQVYKLGTPAKMGPGFFPFWLGLLLVAVGVAVTLVNLRKLSDQVLPKIEWAGLASIIGAVVVCAFLLQPAGIVIAIPAMVAIGSLASRQISPLGLLITAVLLTAMVWLISIAGLGLSIPVLGPAIW